MKATGKKTPVITTQANKEGRDISHIVPQDIALASNEEDTVIHLALIHIIPLHPSAFPILL